MEDIYEEIKEYLNGVINEELEKDDCNTDLIDDCINALDDVKNNLIYPAISMMMQDKDIISYCKRKANRFSADNIISPRHK